MRGCYNATTRDSRICFWAGRMDDEGVTKHSHGSQADQLVMADSVEAPASMSCSVQKQYMHSMLSPKVACAALTPPVKHHCFRSCNNGCSGPLGKPQTALLPRRCNRGTPCSRKLIVLCVGLQLHPIAQFDADDPTVPENSRKQQQTVGISSSPYQ